MSRSIICPDCHKLKPMHPDDVLAGFLRRFVRIRLACSLQCDYCDRPMQAGSDGIAVTYWNKNREGEPRLWEGTYGEITT